MTNPAAMVPSRVGLRMGGAGYSCALVSTAGAQRPSPAAPARPGPWPGFWPALLAIVALGVAIRVLYTLVEAPWPPPGLDDQFYFSALPKLLADGDGFIAPFKFVFDDTAVPTAEHPPLYSVVLAVPALVGLDSPDAQRLAGRRLRRRHDRGARPARAPARRRPRRPDRRRPGGDLPDADRRGRRADERDALRRARGARAAGRLPPGRIRPAPGARWCSARSARWPR